MAALFNWVELLITDVVITFLNFISQFSGDFWWYWFTADARSLCWRFTIKKLRWPTGLASVWSVQTTTESISRAHTGGNHVHHSIRPMSWELWRANLTHLPSLHRKHRNGIDKGEGVHLWDMWLKDHVSAGHRASNYEGEVKWKQKLSGAVTTKNSAFTQNFLSRTRMSGSALSAWMSTRGINLPFPTFTEWLGACHKRSFLFNNYS